MRLIKIYTLSDPYTGDVFYVGATMQALTMRLNNHIYDIHLKYKKGILRDRIKYIKSILKRGKKPEINLIREVVPSMAQQAEREVYFEFKSRGCVLMQSENSLLGNSYSSTPCVRRLIKKEQRIMTEQLEKMIEDLSEIQADNKKTFAS